MRRARDAAASPARTAGAARPSATKPVILGCPAALRQPRRSNAAARWSARCPSITNLPRDSSWWNRFKTAVDGQRDLIRRGAVPFRGCARIDVAGTRGSARDDQTEEHGSRRAVMVPRSARMQLWTDIALPGRVILKACARPLQSRGDPRGSGLVSPDSASLLRWSVAPARFFSVTRLGSDGRCSSSVWRS